MCVCVSVLCIYGTELYVISDKHVSRIAPCRLDEAVCGCRKLGFSIGLLKSFCQQSDVAWQDWYCSIAGLFITYKQFQLPGMYVDPCTYMCMRICECTCIYSN